MEGGGGAGSESFPLTSAQRQLWLLNEVLEDAATYHVHLAWLVERELCPVRLATALALVADRHELLRARLVRHGDAVVHALSERGRPALVVRDLRQLPEQRQERVLERISAEVARERFDLERGPLLRVLLVQLGAGRSALVLVWHHVVTDGQSIVLLHSELSRAYLAMERGAEVDLGPMPRSFRRFVEDERDWLSTAHAERARSYWRGQLAGLERLSFPARPSAPTVEAGVVRRQLSPAASSAVHTLAELCGCSPMAVLLGAWAQVLSMASGQSSFAVGTMLHGREGREYDRTIGYFVRTVPLRVELGADPTVVELMERVRRALFGAMRHRLPYAEIVRCAPEHSATVPGDDPLIQAAFVLEDARFHSAPTFAGSPIAPWGTSVSGDVEGTAKFDLALAVGATPGGYIASAQYRERHFGRAEVSRLLERLEWALERMGQGPDLRLSAVDLLPPLERRELEALNATAEELDAPDSLHEGFEAQARRTPQADAVAFEGERQSFAQLDARANQLAHHLVALGVGPDQRVGVCMPRGAELPLALVAVLKAGGAYVPLDPDYPPARLAWMAADAGLLALLTTSELDGHPWALGLPVVRLDQLDLSRCPATSPAVRVRPEHLAYVIYTSGSTGQPKGAANTHRAVLNRVLWMQRAYPLASADRVLHKTPLSFDVAGWEFWWPLLTGALHVQARPGAHRDPDELAEVIERAGITTLHFVPSMLSAFLDAEVTPRCRSLRRVFCSGEVLTASQRDRFHRQLGAELHNLYGPTEAAIDVTAAACPPGQVGAPPIGQPVSNTQVYVADANLQLAPLGAPGELFLGGVQLARGYWNQPGLTAERFVPNPFGPPGTRLYRTGDRCRWRSDGQLEFLGRLDHQVKLLGVRLELGEIEAALMEHSSVRQAAVVFDDGEGRGKRLVAYVVVEGGAPGVASLRAYLGSRLPAALVPASFEVLESLPLTPSGKVDRRALPAPRRVRGQGEVLYRPPQTGAERLLVEAMASVRGVPASEWGVDDDFFARGGDSLQSLQVVLRAQELGLTLHARDLWAHRTVAALLAAEASSGRPIDWEAEVRLDEEVLPPAPGACSSEGLLLTGASGFVGVHLLVELGRSSSAPLYCLVRAVDAEAGRRRIAEALERYALPLDVLARVVVVPGDLARPLLGLESGDFHDLAQRVSRVVHNGAWVSHSLDYATLAPAQVGSTRELLRLISRGPGASLLLVSTVDVVEPSEVSGGEVAPSEERPPPPTGRGGYAQSKWVAEGVALLARDRGFDVTIARLGLVGGQRSSGRVPVESYWLSQLLRGAARLELWPVVGSPLRLLAVEDAARGLAELGLTHGTHPAVLRLDHPIALSMEAARQALVETGVALRAVTLDDWLEALEALALRTGDEELAFLHFLARGHRQELLAEPPTAGGASCLAAAGLEPPERLIARMMGFVRATERPVGEETRRVQQSPRVDAPSVVSSSTMVSLLDLEDERFFVVANGEEQYSLWPSRRAVPSGWRVIGAEASRQRCLSDIGALWTDMRPRSLREALGGSDGAGAH